MCYTLRNQNTNEENATSEIHFFTPLDVHPVATNDINTMHQWEYSTIYISAQTICSQTLRQDPIPKVSLNCVARMVFFTEITRYEV